MKEDFFVFLYATGIPNISSSLESNLTHWSLSQSEMRTNNSLLRLNLGSLFPNRRVSSLKRPSRIWPICCSFCGEAVSSLRSAKSLRSTFSPDFLPLIIKKTVPMRFFNASASMTWEGGPPGGFAAGCCSRALRISSWGTPSSIEGFRSCGGGESEVGLSGMPKTSTAPPGLGALQMGIEERSDSPCGCWPSPGAEEVSPGFLPLALPFSHRLLQTLPFSVNF